TVEAIDQTEKAFDPTNQDSYHYSTPLPVFDSLGNQHELNVYFVKRADNQWEIKAKDTSVENAEVQELGNVAFDGNGQMLGTNNVFKFEMASLNGSIAAPITIDFNGSKQQEIPQHFIANRSPDGYTAG
ncbi:flagellar hook protein FlgE, partial [Enterobacter hormaechei]|nr:flagellar hook protein FlgE [Enterobacter hormaechei]